MTDPVRRPEWYSDAELAAYQLDPARGSQPKHVLVAGEHVGGIEPIRSDATGAVVGWKARRLSGLAVPRASARYARTQGEAVKDLLADVHVRWQEHRARPAQEPDGHGDEELKPPLTTEERAELLRRYVEDLEHSVAEIAADFDVSAVTVYRYASDAGVHRRNRRGRPPRIRLTDEQMADLRASYPTAEPAAEIARRIGIKVEQLARIASREGLRRPS
jgi:transposase